MARAPALTPARNKYITTIQFQWKCICSSIFPPPSLLAIRLRRILISFSLRCPVERMKDLLSPWRPPGTVLPFLYNLSQWLPLIFSAHLIGAKVFLRFQNLQLLREVKAQGNPVFNKIEMAIIISTDYKSKRNARERKEGKRIVI